MLKIIHILTPFRGDINGKVNLSNYATKTDLKNATGIDTSKLAAKSDLVSWSWKIRYW